MPNCSSNEVIYGPESHRQLRDVSLENANQIMETNERDPGAINSIPGTNRNKS